jgi:cytochrome c oxidase cbb3-type subunit 2
MRTSDALTALAFAACTPALPPEPPQPPDVALGRDVYRSDCAPCHGARGMGEGPAAPYLDVAPRVLADAQFRLRSTASGELPTDRDLYRTISEGVAGTPMRGFAEVLGPHARRSVVAYVKTLTPRFAEAEEPPARVPIPRAPPPNVARGRAVWQAAGCAECHGRTGRGDGPANAELVDERGRPSPSHDFSRGFLKRGVSRRSVYLTLRTGLDGTPMPSYADGLPDADLWALADFTLTLVPPRGLASWLLEPVDRDLNLMR